MAKGKKDSSKGKKNGSPIERNTRESLVQFKFHLIAPALYGTHGMNSNKDYFRSISAITYTLPDGSRRSYSVPTFERWLRDFPSGNMDSLKTKTRSDKGATRKLSPAARIRLAELVQTVPNGRTTTYFNRLKKEHLIEDGAASCSTVRRYIDNNHLREERETAEKLRNEFLLPHAGDLYVTDTCYFEKITPGSPGGKRQWVYVQAIIDDHSRLAMVEECTLSDSAEAFQRTFRKAISLYGVPKMLYTDLGSPYNNNDLTRICNRLGVALVHAHPSDGAAKGVIERSWQSLETDTQVDIVVDELNTFEQIAERVAEWKDEYNSRVNRGVNGVPVERWAASVGRHPIRRLSEKELSEAFSLVRTRQLSNTGILSLDRVRYKVPDKLRRIVRPRTSLDIVYDPLDIPGTIHVEYDGENYPLTVDDPYENARVNADRAREAGEQRKSIAGASAADIRAEERYRARMAGTNRVPGRNSAETDADANDSSQSGHSPGSVAVIDEEAHAEELIQMEFS